MEPTHYLRHVTKCLCRLATIPFSSPFLAAVYQFLLQQNACSKTSFSAFNSEVCCQLQIIRYPGLKAHTLTRVCDVQQHQAGEHVHEHKRKH